MHAGIDPFNDQDAMGIYKNILKGFILPMANEAQISFVLQLDKPIYQGQTVYPYIVIQVKKEVEVEVKTRLKPEHEKIIQKSNIKYIDAYRQVI